jgi:DNA replication protein DnaC|nr:MAG TPA: replicative helicase [Caudoviricetes sp.]
MQKLGFNMQALRKAFEEHGVDTSQPIEDRDAREERYVKKYTAILRKEQAKIIEAQSLYPNDQELTFKFSDWKPALQPDEQQAREIGTKCFRLAKQLSSKPFDLLLTGTPGVGKTSLALAIMDTAKQQGLSTMFVSTIRLRNMYMHRYRDEVIDTNLWATVNAMKRADVLVLDDFGTEGGSLNKVEQDGYVGAHQDMQKDMQDIANARWNDKKNQPGKTTIITSNNVEDELSKIYDPKTISRLIPRNPKYTIAFFKMTDVRGK